MFYLDPALKLYPIEHILLSYKTFNNIVCPLQKASANPKVLFNDRILHEEVLSLTVQQRFTYNSAVLTQNAV